MALNDSLISYWKLDGNSQDAHGDNHGTADVNLTYTAAKLNQGYLADASGTPHIELTNNASLDIAGDLSIACWVLSSNSGANPWMNTCPFLTRLNANGTGAYQLKGATGGVSGGGLYFGVPTPGPELFAPGVMTPNVWHHVVGVRSGGTTLRIYVDGAQVASGTGGAAASAPSSFYHRIGGCALGEEGRGIQLDEIGIWARALSPSEVLELYNGGAGLSYDTFGPTLLTEFPGQFPWGQEDITASAGPTAETSETRLAQYLQRKPNVEAILRAL